MLKSLGALEFGLMSPEMIRKTSVLEIKSPELYDRDGFPIEGGLMDPHLGVVERGRRCKTCGHTVETCPGHFGHIELVRPIIHVGFYKKVDLLLNISCQDCGKIVLNDDEISSINNAANKKDEFYRGLQNKGRARLVCPHCSSKRKKIKLDPPTNFYIEDSEAETGFVRLYPNEIREWFEKIPDKQLELIDFKSRPEWFILTVLPIPPVNMHPSITLDNGIKSEDDLTFKLVDIVVTNNRLKDNINAGTPQLIIEDLWNLLQYNITTYFNNNTPSVPPAKHRSGRPLKTIIQRIKGKSGIIRNNLMGKRVNYAARTTISPDIHISVDELGIPKYISDILTVKEKASDHNLEELKNYVKNNLDQVLYIIKPNGTRRKLTSLNVEILLEEFAQGYSIERKLKNGDWVLFNRQPSLHRGSMMAHKVKVTSGKTIRLNPVAAAPYNADYDGDDMNLHVPQTVEGLVEAKELLAVSENIISPRYGAPIVALGEDGISGAFLLTLFSTKIPKDMAYNYFQVIGLDYTPKPDLDDGYYSGKMIFSLLLPKDIDLKMDTNVSKFVSDIDSKTKEFKNIESEKVLNIENGILKTGVLEKNALGSGVAKLVVEIYDRYGPQRVIEFYNKLNKISTDVLTKFGLTVGLEEYKPSDEFRTFKKKTLDDFFAKTKKYEDEFKKGTLEKLPGKNLNDSFEKYMLVEASNTKKKLEKYIAQEKITKLFSDDPDYNSLIMILSGSRGNPSVLTNIVGLYGQTAVREKRPNRGYTSRVLSTFSRGTFGALGKGFITNGFYDGLSPRELYFHAMGGRQGEVDTGVSTKISGYLYRRISNALRDSIVFPDYSVRTSDNKIIQFVYGDDGIYSQSTYKGDPLYEQKLKNILKDLKV